MPKVASWVRECDEADFQRFFAARAGMELQNARTDPEGAGEDCDGLLLTGGPDIAAEFLRQPIPNPAIIEDAEPARDAWEFTALRAALDGGKPVLAICKGHQLFNVALGGTLLLDIPGHRAQEGKRNNIQPLRYADRASDGPRFPAVNSSHHQAIDQPADGLEIEAWCATDGVIEQVRLKNYPYALGVQFHPERDWLYAPLFDQFFNAIQTTPSP